MQYKHYLVLLFALFLTAKAQGQKAESLAPLSFTEIRVGYGWTKFTVYSYQIELERKFKKNKSISYVLEYHYSRQRGGVTINNPGGSKTSAFPIWRSFAFANIKWHPIKTAKQPFSLLFITGGIGYSNSWYFSKDILDDNGPGIKLGVGIQYTIKEKLTVLAKTQYFYYYNLNYDSFSRIKFDGVPVTISIGYRFLDKK